MGRDARGALGPGEGQRRHHAALSTQSSVLPVGATDTLESVLERVRTSEVADVVLEMDERSPLLISLQHLHRLEEAALEAGVHVSIASTNSKLRNAARVFGIAVVDPRAEPPVEPDPDASAAQLYEDQPFDAAGDPPFETVDQDDGPASGVDLEPAASAEPAAADERWAPARISTFRPARADVRLDPYGQPYTEDDEDEAGDDAAWSDSRRRPRPRAIRPLLGRRQTSDERRATSDELGPLMPRHSSGWEDDDEGEAIYGVEERPPGQFSRLGGMLAGVRAWAEARYGGSSPLREDEGEDDQDEPRAVDDLAGDEHRQADDDDDGWGTLPPATPATRTARAAMPSKVTSPRLPGPRPLVIAHADPISAPEAPDVPGSADEGWDDAGPDADTSTAGDWGDWDDERARPVRRRVGSAAGYVLLGALLALAVAAVALYFLLAGATVTLVARTGSVDTQFLVVVGEIDPNSPQGQPTAEQIVSPARRLTAPVSASASAPASGARLEPDVTAGGPVALSNASTEAVAVPKGTELTAVDGRVYITLDGVTVPPADPYDAAAFGTATVGVAAAVRGSGGNAEVGVVRGRLPSGIFYNNRAAPIAGGSDRRIPVVTKQDQLAAQAAAEEAARARGQGALAALLPPGNAIMRDTAGVGNFKVEFSAAEGSDGTSVTATVTGEATALVYAQSDVDARARAEAEQRLAAGAQPGESLVPGSVRIEAPQLVEERPGIRLYRVAGTAQTRAAVGGDRERAQLAERLAGKSDDEARAVLQTVPGVSSFTIAYAPDWFPQRMPWRAARIEVRIADPP